MKRFALALTFVISAVVAFAQGTIVPLGPFAFDGAQFGNTLVESDGGAFSSESWLNIVNVPPGNPQTLTGAHFNTGIANIGLEGPVTYTIGYQSPIYNRPGPDVGVVVARFSTNSFSIAFSGNGGSSFSSTQSVAASSAQATGVTRGYYFGMGGLHQVALYVHPLDLSNFGVPLGGAINAAMIAGDNELDLVRVAGLVPEPSTWALWIVGAAAWLGLSRHRTRQKPRS